MNMYDKFYEFALAGRVLYLSISCSYAIRKITTAFVFQLIVSILAMMSQWEQRNESPQFFACTDTTAQYIDMYNV